MNEAAEDREMMMRGVKLRLYPDARQVAILNRWLYLDVKLWNLLVEVEAGIYSGKNVRPELGWRQIYADLLQELHERNQSLWENGRPDGERRKGKLTGPERCAEYEREKARWEIENPGKRFAKKAPLRPEPPSAEFLRKKVFAIGLTPLTIEQELGLRAKMKPATIKKIEREFIRANNPEKYAPKLREKAEERIKMAKNAIERHLADPQDYGEADRPGIFIWKIELMALMARLKAVRQTSWIGELPSHASQRVCTDLDKALPRGGSGKGFPRFKSAGKLEGSVYFANTQTPHFAETIATKRCVRLPGGLGDVACHAEDAIRDRLKGLGNKRGGLKTRSKRFFCKYGQGILQGCRVYREGEYWVLTAQFKIPKPKPLPPAGRIGAVKIAASVLLTIASEATSEGSSKENIKTRQVDSLVIEKRLALQYRKAALAQSRKLEALKKRQAKLTEKMAQGGKEMRGRLRKSKKLARVALEMKRLAAIDQRRRDDLMHRETTKIVQNHDVIRVQEMNVKNMMKKKRRADAKRSAKGEGTQQAKVKSVRKLVARAAMARTRMTLQYKAEAAGRRLELTESLKAIVQECSQCGEMNPKMKDGRRIFTCCKCGNKLDKDKNAAKNELKAVRAAREKRNVQEIV